MKAFVINEDQIKNSVMLLVGALLAAFIFGYYLGSLPSSSADLANQAQENLNSKQNIKQLETETLQKNDVINPETIKADKVAEEKRLLKEKEAAARKEAEKKQLAKKEAAKKEAAKKAAAKKEAARKAAAKKEAARKAAARKEAARKEAARKEAAKIEAAKVEAAKLEDISKQKNENDIKSDITKTQMPVDESDLDESDVEKKVYSIQAGMFASEANANSFIDKLAAKQFDAYVSSFMSSSGTTKYNVRVGRFAEREQARELLKEFQKSFSSPAYVVISR
ncbi:MAG: SPOR domain-containing protein [Gammaproteobacteria bacterium]|nr:SPOR domain-containing protein [Gammaproteobacteria bacterium]